jgi:hypothetical protein
MLRLSLFFMFILSTSFSQGTEKRPCETKEHQQFSFWLGEWRVTNKKNTKKLGDSKITSLLNKCVIFEDWTSANGTYRGNSFNYYDRQTKKWHQKWIDNQGNPIEFSGSYAENEIRYTGQSTQGNGKTIFYKLTFIKLSKNLVRQHWEQSEDKTLWKTIFDGYYHRKT